MPSRRRHRTTPVPARPGTAPAGAGSGAAVPSSDPAAMFAAAVRESEARDKATRAGEKAARDAAQRRADEQEAHARALRDARRDLEHAITGVRRAKEQGRGGPEADAAWKVAKARVIELETGERPSWAPVSVAAEPADGDASGGDDVASADADAADEGVDLDD